MITGLGTALITPFKPTGEVDWDALQRLLDQQVAGGVDYIVVLGTTGEAATMTGSEKDAVRQFIVQHINGRLPLVLGVGGNCTAAVVEEIHRLGSALADFKAILSVCPYYNKPSQEGLYQHFAAIAQASPIAVLLYNVPGRTGVNLLPPTVMRLQADYPQQIVGIKEASGNIVQIQQLLDHFRGTDFAVISGDDGLAAEIMDGGGAGLISVASNAWPEEFGRIVRAHDHDVQTRYAAMVELLFKEGNPSGIKTVLNQMGLIQNVLRLPLVPNSQAVQEAIRQQRLALI